MNTITFEETKGGVKVFRDEKHIKTLPVSLKGVYKMIPDSQFELMDKRKRLQPEEVKQLSPIVFPLLLNEFQETIKKHDKYAWELFHKSDCKGVRQVYVKNGTPRVEVCFSNNINARCSEDLLKFAVDVLPDAYLNY